MTTPGAQDFGRRHGHMPPGDPATRPRRLARPMRGTSILPTPDPRNTRGPTHPHPPKARGVHRYSRSSTDPRRLRIGLLPVLAMQRVGPASTSRGWSALGGAI